MKDKLIKDKSLPHSGQKHVAIQQILMMKTTKQKTNLNLKLINIVQKQLHLKLK